ncbi:hypothetical protein FACS1894147_11030 [Spirochaetia bacterium]|nr:hypothetical protein FACS1894147_11030 [Spirochaetia bacterium]
MKIGILTFHRAENFGAVLQTYSLQEYLKSLGHTVEIIDYRNKAIERAYDLYDISFLFKHKNIVKSLWLLFVRVFTFNTQLGNKKKYTEFRNNYLSVSQKMYTSIADFNTTDYDACICGSDQIWNPVITDGLDMVYFLDFTQKKNFKKIIYAASSELYAYKIYQEKRDILSHCIKNLDAISVREESLALEISKYSSKKIHVLLDPVFLSDRSFYLSELKHPGVKKYIFAYYMSRPKLNQGTTLQNAKEEKKNIIEYYAAGIFIVNKKPMNWEGTVWTLMSYIYYADIVITTSYHGMLFSLIFNKDFYVINKGSIIRQRDLLKRLHLESRIIDSYDCLNNCMPIDYTEVNKRLSAYIEESKTFLLHALN